MKVWILDIVICLFYLHLSFAKLEQVQTIFRHGNRTPTNGTNVYPSDPFVNETYEPAGLGALTNDGKKLAYKLGQYFRDRYDELLGPLYSKRIIQFYSSEADRVIMTGELVAAGLYPPVGIQRWNPDLNWQPIPVWPIPTGYNMYGGIFCKSYKKMVLNIKQTDESIKRFIKENKNIYEYLSQHTGANITQDNVFYLRQILFAQWDIGLKLPEWTKPVFPGGKLDELAAFDIIIRSRTNKLKQLSGGTWIKELLKNVDNYINKSDTRKALMYAGHELNIAFFLAALNNFDNEIPYYCDSIMFELHEYGNEYYVQIFYKHKDNVRLLKIPGCNDKMCPLEYFRKFVGPIIPQDVLTLCEREN